MEFIKEYWWCFVVLAVIVLAVIIALCIGKSNKSSEQDNAQPKEENTEEQENVQTEKTEEVKKPRKPRKPVNKKDTEQKEEKVEEKVEEPQTTENEVEEKEENKSERKQRYFVTFDKERKDWIVKKTDSSRASKRCKTKAEALEVATRLSESQELSLTVKKKDGKFQNKGNVKKQLKKAKKE